MLGTRRHFKPDAYMVRSFNCQGCSFHISISYPGRGFILIYTFPLALIVIKSLEKIKKSVGTHGILIAFHNPSRPWHSLLLNISIRDCIPQQDIPLYQFLPHLRRPGYHQNPGLLDLAAWMLSGRVEIPWLCETRSQLGFSFHSTIVMHVIPTGAYL